LRSANTNAVDSPDSVLLDKNLMEFTGGFPLPIMEAAKVILSSVCIIEFTYLWDI